ncbi:hypothetical protein N7510_007904 [Penicillium lagena]|uniref:uncharacterized protein n=1 Tax=Penicillium lagena TaxID=94218 RepID=UPI0025425B39|nr:uncharacterized protein N7510_007904 [Penicillium lagena]KAJ5611185.1 hypothetical protein N7510_007904 [Penicillium lagena]
MSQLNPDGPLVTGQHGSGRSDETYAASVRQNPRRVTGTPSMILPRRGSRSACMTGSSAPDGRSVGARPRVEAGTDGNYIQRELNPLNSNPK